MKSMINPGKYRHQVTIRHPASDSSRDSFGARKGRGPDGFIVWAEKQDWSGSEVNEAGRETSNVVTKFKIRYRTGVAAKMQVVHGEDEYNILSVLDFDGLKRELVLECRKVVA